MFAARKRLVGHRSPCRKSLRRNGARHGQRSSLQPVYRSVVTGDVAATAVEVIAAAALRARLRSYSKVEVKVTATAWDLLSGRIDGAKVEGRLWESPLGLTARVLDVQVGRVELDLPAVLSQQRILLRNTPLGAARAVFNAADFGAFLQHPLLTASARTAVQGRPFLFDRHGITIAPGPAFDTASGCVLFSGTLVATGQRYHLTMRPAQGGRRALVTATPTARSAQSAPAPQGLADASPGRQEPPRTQPHLPPQPQAQARDPHRPARGPAGTSASAVAVLAPAAAGVSLASAGSGEGEEDPMVSSELSRFFSGLLVDLQGAELAFRSMRISHSAAAAGVERGLERGRAAGLAKASAAAPEGLLELELAAAVRSFPPLNLQF